MKKLKVFRVSRNGEYILWGHHIAHVKSLLYRIKKIGVHPALDVARESRPGMIGHPHVHVPSFQKSL